MNYFETLHVECKRKCMNYLFASFRLNLLLMPSTTCIQLGKVLKLVMTYIKNVICLKLSEILRFASS